MPLLCANNLDTYYGAIHALKGVSLSVESGEVLTLIGCNGAGKSTTLRSLSGMVRPRRGDVTEGRGIFANLTVEENLMLGAYARADRPGIAEDRERALGLFPRVRERLRQVAGTLSGGEQQMLAIARALMARPKLLLLDEPSLGLAPQLVKAIFAIIREINKQGVTILLVEQNAHMALNVAHRAVVLETGRVAMSGPAADLAKSDEVRKAYLGHG
jgi:branched-chain amino acid transport system ATP-binding protein